MAQSYTKWEISAGLFMVGGIVLLGYLALSLGDIRVSGTETLRIQARFANVGDLGRGAPVRLAGVKTGEVVDIRLVDYVAEVDMEIRKSPGIPADTIASISRSGLLGESYVALSPGASAETLTDGQKITRTEPAIDIGALIKKYAFGSPSDKQDNEQDQQFEDPIE